MRQEVGESWQQVSAEVLSGLRDWRAAHPRATFAELEEAVEAALARLRVRLLEDAALASAAARVAGRPADERPRCPSCQGPLEARGEREREVLVQGGRAVRLRRSYTVCQACGRGVFPPG